VFEGVSEAARRRADFARVKAGVFCGERLRSAREEHARGAAAVGPAASSPGGPGGGRPCPRAAAAPLPTRLAVPWMSIRV